MITWNTPMRIAQNATTYSSVRAVICGYRIAMIPAATLMMPRIVRNATEMAAETWQGREQYCHISSHKGGWKGANNRAHADYVNPADFPDAWLGRAMTVDIEAKAKERAVVAIMESFKSDDVAAAAGHRSPFARATPADRTGTVTATRC